MRSPTPHIAQTLRLRRTSADVHTRCVRSARVSHAEPPISRPFVDTPPGKLARNHAYSSSAMMASRSRDREMNLAVTTRQHSLCPIILRKKSLRLHAANPSFLASSKQGPFVDYITWHGDEYIPILAQRRVIRQSYSEASRGEATKADCKE